MNKKTEKRRLKELFPAHLKAGELKAENVHWLSFDEVKSKVMKAKERGESHLKLEGCMDKKTELAVRFRIKGMLLCQFDYYLYASLLSDVRPWLSVDF